MDELPWPVLGSEVLAAKAIPERAMRQLYEPVYPGVYAPAGVELTARQRAHAAWLWSRRRAVVAGNSAAALLGAKWVNPALDAELVHANRKPPPRIVVHTDRLAPHETVAVDGVAVTTPARTAFDIGRRTPSRLQAVQRLDALANSTDVKVADVQAVIAEHTGARPGPPPCGAAADRRGCGIPTGDVDPIGVDRCRSAEAANTDQSV